LKNLGYIQLIRKWGSYHYIIYEDPDYTTGTGADCRDHTTGSSTCCTGAILTTTNNNYYNTEESADQSVNEPEKEVTTMIPDEPNSNPLKEFVELNKLYPHEVIRPDGSRAYLKSDHKRCEELYITYLKERLLSHDEVMNCLKTELQVRNQNGKMKYIKEIC
jgi:hypothetical protein